MKLTKEVGEKVAADIAKGVKPGKRTGYYGAVQPTYETVGPKPEVPSGDLADLRVFILCAGGMHPWEGDRPRQLRHWKRGGDESVLGRQIRQVKTGSGQWPIVVTHRSDIMNYIEGCRYETLDGYPFFYPDDRRCIADTWLSTVDWWADQTVVILGDVIFGKLTMGEMLRHRGSMWMVGNDAEIYAWSFDRADHEKLIDVLYEVNVETYKGAPWEIYKCWMGYPKPYHQQQPHMENSRIPGGAPGEIQRKSGVFQWTWDRCGDVDTPKEYEGALRVDWETEGMV